MFRGRSQEEVSTFNFEREYANANLVLQYKKEYYDTEVKTKTNIRRIEIVVDLPAVMKNVLQNGTVLGTIRGYYQKYRVGCKFETGSVVSIPVGDSEALRSIVLNDETSENEKIESLIAFYVRHFEVRSITQIIEDCYDPTRRNDFATAITVALPEGLLFKRLYDEFFQLKRNIRSVKDLVDRTDHKDLLEDGILEIQIENVKNAKAMVHHLGTPEGHAAAHLSVLLEGAVKLLNVENVDGESPLNRFDYSGLSKNMRDDIERMSVSPYRFRDLLAIVNKHEKSIKEFIFHDENLKKTVLVAIATAKTCIPIPDDEKSLEALDCISEIRKRLVQYRVDEEQKLPVTHSTRSIVTRIRANLGADLQSKFTFVDSAVVKLDEFCTSIRTGVREADDILSPSGKSPKEMNEVNNVPQLYWLSKRKLPINSKLPGDLAKILELEPDLVSEPPAELAPVSSSSSSSSGPLSPSYTSPEHVMGLLALVGGSMEEQAAQYETTDEINLLRGFLQFIDDSKNYPELMFHAMSTALPLFQKHHDNFRRKYREYFAVILESPLAVKPEVVILIGQLNAKHSSLPTKEDLQTLKKNLELRQEADRPQSPPSSNFMKLKRK